MGGVWAGRGCRSRDTGYLKGEACGSKFLLEIHCFFPAGFGTRRVNFLEVVRVSDTLFLLVRSMKSKRRSLNHGYQPRITPNRSRHCTNGQPSTRRIPANVQHSRQFKDIIFRLQCFSSYQKRNQTFPRICRRR